MLYLQFVLKLNLVSVIPFTYQRYESAKVKGKYNYDRDMEDALERHIGECDRKITRALRRLEDDDSKDVTTIFVFAVTQVGLYLACIFNVMWEYHIRVHTC